MARVTVEDCVSKVPNRFELVLLATARARELSSGALPTLPRDNDKNPVIALREIAESSVSVDMLRDHLIELIQLQKSGFSSEATHDAELNNVMQQEETSYLQEDVLIAESAALFSAEGEEDLEDGDTDAVEEEEESLEDSDTEEDDSDTDDDLDTSLEDDSDAAE